MIGWLMAIACLVWGAFCSINMWNGNWSAGMGSDPFGDKIWAVYVGLLFLGGAAYWAFIF